MALCSLFKACLLTAAQPMAFCSAACRPIISDWIRNPCPTADLGLFALLICLTCEAFHFKRVTTKFESQILGLLIAQGVETNNETFI